MYCLAYCSILDVRHPVFIISTSFCTMVVFAVESAILYDLLTQTTSSIMLSLQVFVAAFSSITNLRSVIDEFLLKTLNSVS